MTAEKDDGAITSIQFRGATKDDLPIPMAGAEPCYPLDDPSLANQLDFYQAATGIKNPSELRSHIISIQEEAYKLFPYPCIWTFNFLGGKAVNHHLYPHIRQVAQNTSDHQQIFLDIGAFMGTDLRQVVHDGWEKDNVLGIDIVHDWFRLGCKLFNDAEQPIPFFVGDIFNSEVLDPSDSNLIAPDLPAINLREIKDLNILKHRAKFVMANSLFHLFGEEDQHKLAKCCRALLSDEPGSAIFGLHRGEKVKGTKTFLGRKEAKMFCHSPESWKELWHELFKPDEVQVFAYLEQLGSENRNHFALGDEHALFLRWSVTRT